MNKLIPIFIAFLHDLAAHNGVFQSLVDKYLGLLKSEFKTDFDKVSQQRKDEFQQRQAALEGILAGSPEQRRKVLLERKKAAEEELALLEKPEAE